MTSPLQQKIKIHGPVVITANRLGDGAVIYRTGANSWTETLAGAAVTTEVEIARALLIEANADPHAVGAYIAPVVQGADGRILPGNLRERIRADGPTIDYPGKPDQPGQPSRIPAATR